MLPIDIVKKIKENDVTAVKKWAESVSTVDTETYKGVTPLCVALLGEHTECAKILLEHGASIYKVNEQLLSRQHDVCSTVFVMAAAFGSYAIVELLLKFNNNVNERNNHKKTALHYVCKNENLKLAKLLLEHGADVNAQELSKTTPLYYAIENNNIEMIKLLFAYGANANLPFMDSVSYLQMAVESNNIEIIKLLINHGGKLNV